jgi:hypothetical protein
MRSKLFWLCLDFSSLARAPSPKAMDLATRQLNALDINALGYVAARMLELARTEASWWVD